MSISEQDLSDFHRFAELKLSNGGADSMEQLAREWSEAREIIESIQQSEADIEAGRVQPAEKVFAELRQKFNLPE